MFEYRFSATFFFKEENSYHPYLVHEQQKNLLNQQHLFEVQLVFAIFFYFNNYYNSYILCN